MSTVREYGTKFDADTAKALLAEYGIDSAVYGDPAHHVAPHLVTEAGFELMVLTPQIDEALEILGPQNPALDELEAHYHHRSFADRPKWIRVLTYLLLLSTPVPLAIGAAVLLVDLLQRAFP